MRGSVFRLKPAENESRQSVSKFRAPDLKALFWKMRNLASSFLKKAALPPNETAHAAKAFPKRFFEAAVSFFAAKKRTIFKISALLICIITAFASLPSSDPPARYNDVPEKHWAYPYITYLSEKGFLRGYVGGNFSPDSSVTVAEFIAAACRMTGMDDTKLEKSGYSPEAAIKYANYMNWVKDKDVPSADYSKPITRELAVKIAITAFFPQIAKEASVFLAPKIENKNEIDPVNLKSIRLAYSMGILTGYADGAFKAKENLSRAEAAAMLYRVWSKYYKEPSGLESVTVPILLYHHISNSPGYTTPAKFREDMENLKKAGFSTIFYRDLYEYAANGKELPEKPVIVSFDDGYYSNYEHAYPVLKELGMKAEISVIGCWVGIKDHSGVIPHFGWSEAKEMYRSETVHIEAHSYRMHDYDPNGKVTRHGVLKRQDEDYERYIKAFVSDTKTITSLIEENMDYKPIAYTYPNGYNTPLSEKILESLGYKITLTINEGINTIIKGDTSSLMHLKRIAVDNYKGDVVSLINRRYI